MFWTILSWIGWVILGIFAIVILPFVIDSLISRFGPSGQSRVDCWRVSHRGPGFFEYRSVHTDYAPRRNEAYVAIPGILAHRNYAEPLLHVLGDYDLYVLHYAGLRYNRGVLVDQGAYTVRWLLGYYDTVVLDGISHGGQGVVHIMNALTVNERRRVNVALHDAPTGAATLKQVPGFATGLFLFTAGPVANVVLSFIPKLFAALGKPKRETVKTPNVDNMFLLNGQRMTDTEYFEWVTWNAKRNLSGHLFSMWYSEIGDMVRAGKEGLPYHALNDARSVVYIAYDDSKNDVVSQPDAAYTFKANVPGMLPIWVSGTHAGFLDYNDVNVAALKDALSK